MSFALDDFGAGLIAFRHLKDVLFDCVKIDRTWVAGLDRQPDNQVLCEALVTVAHQFEMIAVAEGVETEGEAAALGALGVDCLQGYLFGRPQPGLRGPRPALSPGASKGPSPIEPAGASRLPAPALVSRTAEPAPG